MDLCVVKNFLGFDCPGCGLTRSVLAMFRGDLRESIALHPLGVVILVISLLVVIERIQYRFTHRSYVWGKRSSILIGYGFLVGLFVHWFVKIFLLDAFL
ncbi:MAG: DUF2752 domain-containing protein [Deltaproteobacteria bacterium]|nr:DUF2752 domain-containing protein [Deltaproteobacteria bacterium]